MPHNKHCEMDHSPYVILSLFTFEYILLMILVFFDLKLL